MFLILSSGQLVAQESPDTTRTYGITTLQNIAANLVDCLTCDSLLENANTKLSIKDSVSLEKTKQINLLNKKIGAKDQKAALDDATINMLKSTLDDSRRRNNFLKIGWGVTTSILSGFTVYFMIK